MPKQDNKSSESSNAGQYLKYAIGVASIITVASLAATGLIVPAAVLATVVATSFLGYKVLTAGNDSIGNKKSSGKVGIEPSRKYEELETGKGLEMDEIKIDEQKEEKGLSGEKSAEPLSLNSKERGL